VLESVYGRFIVNRYCAYQAEVLVKTGKTHIEPELNNIRTIVDTLPSECLIVDGGANIGFFGIPIAQEIKTKAGKMICFEPQRMLFNALAGTVALNDLDNVFVHNLGLSDQEGWATLPEVDYSKPADFGMVSLNDIDEVKESAALRNRVVKVVPLDSFELPRLDFFKLDVEGYEVPAIKGALQTIKKYRPWIWVEFWIVGEDAIKSALTEVQDYDFVRVAPLNMVCMPREKLVASNLKIV
jgi:FkbM family methyltransferase